MPDSAAIAYKVVYSDYQSAMIRARGDGGHGRGLGAAYLEARQFHKHAR